MPLQVVNRLPFNLEINAAPAAARALAAGAALAPVSQVGGQPGTAAATATVLATSHKVSSSSGLAAATATSAAATPRLGARPAAAAATGAGLPPSTSSGSVTHGSQITTSNTGYQAYLDPGLGRTLVAGDLTRATGTHFISDFTTGGTGGTQATPKIVEKLDVDEVIFDVPWVTLRYSNIRNPATAFLNGNHIVGARMEWCTIVPATVGDECMKFESWSAYRCQWRGCSDGAKINGGTQPITITECYIGVKMASADDHNDCVQNVGGTGTVTITRSNLSVAPEGGLITGGSGGPNACIMSADMSGGSVFSLSAVDCYFNGGTSAGTVRLYDGALTANITYSVTGCLWERTAAPPVDRGTSNTTPVGQITWSNNRWADDLSTIALT